jgi:hypothetical protein
MAYQNPRLFGGPVNLQNPETWPKEAQIGYRNVKSWRGIYSDSLNDLYRKQAYLIPKEEHLKSRIGDVRRIMRPPEHMVKFMDEYDSICSRLDGVNQDIQWYHNEIGKCDDILKNFQQGTWAQIPNLHQYEPKVSGPYGRERMGVGPGVPRTPFTMGQWAPRRPLPGSPPPQRPPPEQYDLGEEGRAALAYYDAVHGKKRRLGKP